MSAIAIIPARYGSRRFPGKPLAAETGKPLIQHVVEQVQRAETVSRVIVATDDDRIVEAVTAFGGETVRTSSDHPNGTSRIAEVAGQLNVDQQMPVLNVQGDEPELPPAVIDQLVQQLQADDEAPMATVASPFAEDEDPAKPHIVKVVQDQQCRALYFSRSLIPHDRDGNRQAPPRKHAGIYAYRWWFLLHYVELAPTPLEETEQLEQLRALEHGYSIAVTEATLAHHGIDTPEQYQAFVQRQEAGQ